MNIDTNKIDEAALALLHLYSWQEGDGHLPRAWKGFDWGVLERLHEQGLITNPVGKARSLHLTEEGTAKGVEVASRLFGTGDS